jgi:hypothetical protein
VFITVNGVRFKFRVAAAKVYDRDYAVDGVTVESEQSSTPRINAIWPVAEAP